MVEYTKQLSTEAAPEAVWEAFIHIEAWPQWTTSIRKVRRLDDGPLRVGSAARVSQPGMLPAKWTVSRLDPVRTFTWESTALGVSSIAEHEVTSSEGQTNVVLSIRMHGPLAGIVGVLYGRRIRRFVDLEAQGIVAAAHARSPDQAAVSSPPGEAGQ